MYAIRSYYVNEYDGEPLTNCTYTITLINTGNTEMITYIIDPDDLGTGTVEMLLVTEGSIAITDDRGLVRKWYYDDDEYNITLYYPEDLNLVQWTIYPPYSSADVVITNSEGDVISEYTNSDTHRNNFV